MKMPIGFYISSNTRCRNRVTQHFAAGYPDALGGFVSAPHFGCAEDGKQFARRYVGNRTATERGVGKAQ